MKEWILSGAIGAFLLSAFHFLYGEGSARYLAIFLYVFLLIMDWLAGYRASKIDGSYASEYGIKGGYRAVFILGMPSIGHQIDQISGTPGVAFYFLTAAFGLHIWKSMTANVIRAGWEKWVPGWAMIYVAEELEHKISRAIKRRTEKEKYLGGDDSGSKDNRNASVQ
ncbi:phage holin family protein [Brevibacillus reuszeri]|uniref:phage holin family protein n=1 Tax=Brevibacillus reuszeri TaxID=54915 RepID=UPI000CCC0BD3|nr:phage holin family protein [Brevibacillus reuszeri]